jgi:hypothetical protein
VNHLTPRCESCGGALECFEGHHYCPDCTAYTTAPAPVYRDGAGVPYYPIALVPWCELTEGDRYAVPGETAIHVRSAVPSTPGLWSEYPAISRGLHNRPVLLLERDGPDDRVVDLVDDQEPPF